MALRLALGSATPLCAATGRKHPPETNDTTTKFVGIPNGTPPAPGLCPAVPS